jgi:aquaporin Z
VSSAVKHVEGIIAERIERDVLEPMADFQDPSQEWRRLFSELYGTFRLVIVAAGGGMIGQAFPDTISRTAAVVAPGLMVMGIIMFMGKVSGYVPDVSPSSEPG